MLSSAFHIKIQNETVNQETRNWAPQYFKKLQGVWTLVLFSSLVKLSIYEDVELHHTEGRWPTAHTLCWKRTLCNCMTKVRLCERPVQCDCLGRQVKQWLPYPPTPPLYLPQPPPVALTCLLYYSSPLRIHWLNIGIDQRGVIRSCWQVQLGCTTVQCTYF